MVLCAVAEKLLGARMAHVVVGGQNECGEHNDTNDVQRGEELERDG